MSTVIDGSCSGTSYTPVPGGDGCRGEKKDPLVPHSSDDIGKDLSRPLEFTSVRTTGSPGESSVLRPIIYRLNFVFFTFLFPGEVTIYGESINPHPRPG